MQHNLATISGLIVGLVAQYPSIMMFIWGRLEILSVLSVYSSRDPEIQDGTLSMNSSLLILSCIRVARRARRFTKTKGHKFEREKKRGQEGRSGM